MPEKFKFDEYVERTAYGLFDGHHDDAYIEAALSKLCGQWLRLISFVFPRWRYLGASCRHTDKFWWVRCLYFSHPDTDMQYRVRYNVSRKRSVQEYRYREGRSTTIPLRRVFADDPDDALHSMVYWSGIFEWRGAIHPTK